MRSIVEKAWFEMHAETRRRLADAVWIPLKQWSETKRGEYGQLGYQSQLEGVHSVAIRLDRREEGEEINWSSTSNVGVWASKDAYKAADAQWGDDGDDIGVVLVLEQSFDGAEPSLWHLNQDLTFALGLLREDDVWVRPSEGYDEVVRLERNDKGRPASIKIRADYLRDYLAARRMALRVSAYRSRDEVVEDASFVDWSADPTVEERDGGRFEGRAWAIHEGGHPFGTTTGVFQMSRTDVDTEAEVPRMDQASDEGVSTQQWSFQRQGRKLWQIEGEFWRDEWIEPAQASPRVRRDHVPSSNSFIVDGAGQRRTADELDSDEIGLWLWFSPAVIPALLARRGGGLKWHTRETGSVWIAGGMPVHFGINERGLINTYAHDVARLDEWERQIWAGHNVGPDGGVSQELTAAQVKTSPADTKAPEAFLGSALKALNEAFQARFGVAFVKEHEEHEGILERTHRFRVTDRPSLLALAKDVARLTADSFDVAALRKILSTPKEERLGSLKGVQRLLERLIGKEKARELMGPLVGIYDLRLGDAHLPSSTITDALKLVEIDSDQPWLNQGRDLLHITVSVLYTIAAVLRDAPHPEKEE